MLANETLIDGELLRQRILQVPFIGDFIEAMLSAHEVEMRDICDWCGWEMEEARQLLSFFVRKHALQRVKNSYRKTSAFIELLKEMRDSDAVKKNTRPDFIKDVNIREF
jgi:hypothetical protein